MTMKVKDLIEILSRYDGDAPVVIEAYGESSQGTYTYEVDVEVESGNVVITPGSQIGY